MGKRNYCVETHIPIKLRYRLNPLPQNQGNTLHLVLEWRSVPFLPVLAAVSSDV